MQCEIRLKAARLASIRSCAEFILSLSKGSRPTRPALVLSKVEGMNFSLIIFHPSTFILLVQPFCYQGGFAEAGRGGDEGELVTELQSLIEPIDELRPGDEVRPQRRDV